MEFDLAFRDDLLDDEHWRAAMIGLRMPAPGQYGRLRVVQEASDRLPLFGRQLVLSAPVTYTLVYEGATLWMSDTPQERLMMLAGTAGMGGHVLVAGGGLGMYPQYARRYGRAEQVTVVERHPDVAALLQTTLGADPAITIVNQDFASYLEQALAAGWRFDGCYIDIHPTIDPAWLPGLNWLRQRSAPLVSGPLRIWGYNWMLRELAAGLEREYLPLLRQGRRFATTLGGDLALALPPDWQDWPLATLRGWLATYASAVAWPLEFQPS